MIQDTASPTTLFVVVITARVSWPAPKQGTAFDIVGVFSNRERAEIIASWAAAAAGQLVPDGIEATFDVWELPRVDSVAGAYVNLVRDGYRSAIAAREAAE